MKKISIALLLIISSTAVFAQSGGKTDSAKHTTMQAGSKKHSSGNHKSKSKTPDYHNATSPGDTLLDKKSNSNTNHD